MAEFKEAFKKVLAETFKEMTGKSTIEDPTTKDPTAEDLTEAIARQIDIKTSSQDATSIKGKVVDDSEIGDGKALVYSGVKDKIIYKRVGRGGGGGGVIGGGVIGGGDMTKAVYDTDADNVVESADNADTVDGFHATDLGTGLAGTWATGTATGSNPITKAHGLGGIPSLVLTGLNAAQPYVVSWTADATNLKFYHNAAATLTIHYAARL